MRRNMGNKRKESKLSMMKRRRRKRKVTTMTKRRRNMKVEWDRWKVELLSTHGRQAESPKSSDIHTTLRCYYSCYFYTMIKVHY